LRLSQARLGGIDLLLCRSRLDEIELSPCRILPAKRDVQTRLG
jgi:hypothetical protein